MPRLSFDGFSILAPDGWEEITESNGGNPSPLTIAKRDGVGALQFSTALYEEGRQPDPTPDDLLGMVMEFTESRGWGQPNGKTTAQEPIRLGAGSIRDQDWFIRLWYVSDGWNVGFVTYTCEWGQQARELEECEAIVRTIRFESRHRGSLGQAR